MLTSIFPLLKVRFPEAVLDVLCGSWSLPVLENNPLVHNRIVLNHPAYNRGKISFARKLLDFFRGVGQTLKIMRRERYDLCLNLRDAGGDLILLARLGGCRHIIGHATGGCGPLLDAVVPWTEGCHEVEHYLELLRPLGVEASLAELHYEVFPSLADEAHVARIIKEYRLGPFVVLHPGCGDKRKLRSSNFWAEVIAGIDPALGVVVTGTDEEMPLFECIAGSSNRKIHALFGVLSIVQLFVLMRSSSAVYALDSLAAHLGAAAGVPTRVFWSDTNDPDQWRPLGVRVEICLNVEKSED